MTDIFDREMQRIIGDTQFWCARLSQIGDYKLEPTPVSYSDGTGSQPFRWPWKSSEYGTMPKATSPARTNWQRSSKELCELLWSHIGGSSYDIPNAFWDTPLGFMCQLARARESLESGGDLNAEQLAMLAGDIGGPDKADQGSREIPAKVAAAVVMVAPV